MPSLAYRLALVAAGEGEAAVAERPGGGDYAAGHALLRAVGGALVDQHGAPVTYTPDGRSSARHVFGGAPALVARAGRAGPARRRARGRARPTPLPGWRRPGRPAGRPIADAGLLAARRAACWGSWPATRSAAWSSSRARPRSPGAYPGGLRAIVADGGTWGTLAGQPTDDSELALALARALVAGGAFDAEAVADRLRRLVERALARSTSAARPAGRWAPSRPRAPDGGRRRPRRTPTAPARPTAR